MCELMSKAASDNADDMQQYANKMLILMLYRLSGGTAKIIWCSSVTGLRGRYIVAETRYRACLVRR